MAKIKHRQRSQTIDYSDICQCSEAYCLNEGVEELFFSKYISKILLFDFTIAIAIKTFRKDFLLLPCLSTTSQGYSAALVAPQTPQKNIFLSSLFPKHLARIFFLPCLSNPSQKIYTCFFASQTPRKNIFFLSCLSNPLQGHFLVYLASTISCKDIFPFIAIKSQEVPVYGSVFPYFALNRRLLSLIPVNGN